MRIPWKLLLLALSFSVAGAAGAVTITFDEAARGYVHGSVVGVADYALDPGPTLTSITVTNLGGGPDLGVIFSTTFAGATSDDDLLGPPFGPGNLDPGTQLGNLLIVQENTDGCGDGVCDDPDDEAGKPAGDIEFVFSSAMGLFGFDVVDIEAASASNGHVELFDGGASVVVGWTEFTTGGLYDQGAVWGGNSINRFTLTAAEVGLDSIDKAVVRMGGSSGIDNIQFVPTRMPEPGTLLLLGSGLAGLALLGRREVR